MLQGTLYASLESKILPATDENMARTAQENYDESGYWGRIMQVRNSAGEDIETPGLAVLEIPEEFYDVELDAMLPGRTYWLATERDIFEVPDSITDNLRLGAALGIIDADFMGGPDAPDFAGELRNTENLYPLDKLIGFDGLENPSQSRETAELDLLEASVIVDTLDD